MHTFFAKDGRWPQFGVLDRHLDRDLGIEDAAEHLAGIPIHLLYTDRFGLVDPRPDMEVGLSVAGLALCVGAKRILRLYVEVLRWLAKVERTATFDEETTEITVDSEQVGVQLAEAHEVSVTDLRAMYHLLRQEPSRIWKQMAGRDDETWSITLSRGVRRFRKVSDVDEYLSTFRELMVEGGMLRATQDPPPADPAPHDYEHDVALSFAGENRPYVDRVAHGLKARGIRVFYDRFFEVDAWGAELPEFFDDAFRRKARFTVAFVSVHYAVKPWTTTERRSAFARALNEASPYLLPVRLDDTDLPGLRPTVGFIDGRLRTPEQIVELIVAKLGQDTTEPTPAFFGVPRTEGEEETLLALHPAYWEYLLFAGILDRGKRELEPKWHDHQLGYRTAGDRYVEVPDATSFLGDAFHEAVVIGDNLGALFEPDIHERAFGPPGEPGDPTLILHLGRRILGEYDNFLEWGAKVRSARLPEELTTAQQLAARFVDRPIERFREFIDSFVEQCQRIPELLAASEERPIMIEVDLVLDLDDEVQERFHEELAVLRRSYGI